MLAKIPSENEMSHCSTHVVTSLRSAESANGNAKTRNFEVPEREPLMQAKRVIQRDWKMVVERTYFRYDGHDNNFLLIEAALAVPFAIGYRTGLIAPLLAITLIGEAIFCWWPLESWSSV